MKLKFCTTLLAALMLASCGGSEGGSPTPTPTPTPTPQDTWEYLNFLSGEKTIRFDLFNIEEGILLSYGNASLSESINNLTLDVNSCVTVNKDSTNEKSFTAIYILEDGTGSSRNHVHGSIEGDHISEFFNDIAKDYLADSKFKRAYVAFSMDTSTRWTRGLNENLDAYLDAIFNK